MIRIRQEKLKCPKCHRYFRDDIINKYVVGTVKNTLKFTVNGTLRLGGSSLGSCLGGGTGGRIGGTAGAKLAEAIGCGFEDMNGWKHHCPYCSHKW